ncbi:hypothetical protein G7Y89_g1578 [Cudoniella acicularis]|uniref:TLDc domain-containing protein n=1 Tax=Cudoniella acicularis TaxID=354080 RepID=A0A8H4RW41_9HELO|nr:hypothetical protein G7Y89_g1578 [Cudoniella acicularis]
MANKGIGIDQGIMAKEPIMERFDDALRNSHAIRSDEEPLLADIFDKTSILTKPTFISLLANKAALPHSSEGVEAGEIMYASMAYLATLPFPHYLEGPDAQPLKGLSSKQLKRGLVWVMSDRIWRIVDKDDRLRTESDHLRLIFQSLASVTYCENSSDATRDSPDETYSSDPDSDGDEIYQDLLDVVYSTQVVRQYGGHLRVGLRRDRFRLVCKSLKKEYKVPSFNQLAIPIQRFMALLRCLLLLQFEPIKSIKDLSRFNSAAQSVCASFLQKPDDKVITWPTFEYAVMNIAPYLFDSYYRLLTHTFLAGDSSCPFGVLDAAEVPSAPAGIALTLPLQSQLVTFLNGSVGFGIFTRMRHYGASNLPTPTALVSTMQEVPDEAILVLFGKMATGESCTFGLFSPKPRSDGPSIQTNYKPTPNHVGYERCAIFQLTPVQDVYRGVVGKPGWIVDDKSVTFGQGYGVVMTLKDNLANAEVRHQISDRDEIGSTYEANPWRGNWVMDFEITEVEIWSDVLYKGRY